MKFRDLRDEGYTTCRPIEVTEDGKAPRYLTVEQALDLDKHAFLISCAIDVCLEMGDKRAAAHLASELVELDGALHWTARHIVREGDEFVGYDEAGLEYTRSTSRESVVAALVAYDEL